MSSVLVTWQCCITNLYRLCILPLVTCLVHLYIVLCCCIITDVLLVRLQTMNGGLSDVRVTGSSWRLTLSSRSSPSNRSGMPRATLTPRLVFLLRVILVRQD